jgi:hypothetical protein
MNIADSNPPGASSKERKIVSLLCGLAAVHVFIFSAAFPFFNNVDEEYHFDLLVKYSHGRIPRVLEPLSDESIDLILVGSPEYLHPAYDLPVIQSPLPAWLTTQKLTLSEAREQWKRCNNYEVTEPPLYYALMGLDWRLGKILGFHDAFRLYWMRFSNVLGVAALVWIGYAAGRIIFPESSFFRMGIPALLAFIPQTAFYSIQNDTLSPLCFGLAFVCLIQLLRADVLDLRFGAMTGLTLAATGLTKLTNLPLLAVSLLAVLFKMLQLAKTGKWRASWPSLAVLALCAGLPMTLWFVWCKFNFGDFTGTELKIHCLDWTCKPFHQWWHHPIFSTRGLWTFISGLLVTFWQGEFLWHGGALNLPVVDAFYVVPTLCLLGLAVAGLFPRYTIATAPQRQALGLSLCCFAAGVAFLAFLSIIYDFGNCPHPSRDHPYFDSGRLILGVLIPFLLLLLYGVNLLLRGVKNRWVRPLAIIAMILFMLISEIVTDWPVFSSQYNWFHM